MVGLILFILISVGLMGYAVWPAVPDTWKRTSRPSPAAADAVPAGPAAPESLEGVLVGQLAAATISRRQYIRAMERLAARDDKRHPVVVPPETGSAA
jgi:hypothetical protein